MTCSQDLDAVTQRSLSMAHEMRRDRKFFQEKHGHYDHTYFKQLYVSTTPGRLIYGLADISGTVCVSHSCNPHCLLCMQPTVCQASPRAGAADRSLCVADGIS